MDLAVPLAGRVCLDLYLNLGHQRRNGGDRARHCESFCDGEPCLFETRAHPFANRPDRLRSWKLPQTLQRKISNDLVKATYQPLIRSEDQGAYRRIPGDGRRRRNSPFAAQTEAQPELDRTL